MPPICVLLTHPLLPLTTKTGKSTSVTKSTHEHGWLPCRILIVDTLSYYDSYLAFYSLELVQHGLDSTLEKYFFSADANWGRNEEDTHPEMLSRLLAGLVHPYIFVGYGVEFGMLGMVAEGIDDAS